MTTTEFKDEDYAAAKRYADCNGETGNETDIAYNAFLAGIEFQKNKFHDPEKEYYGF